MLTINELATRANAPAHVVRYYVRIGLIQSAATQDNGYRLFPRQEVSRLRFIRMAKNLGFTLNEIKQIILHTAADDSPCDYVREIIQHRIEENRVKINEMLELQSRMELALEQWKQMPNGVPDGHSVCHLIESFGNEEEAEGCNHEKC